jgi:uncharacterized protein YegP (UPF0339 family)
MRYVMYEDSTGTFRWRLHDDSDGLIAVCVDGFRDENECLEQISLVKTSAHVPIERTGSLLSGLVPRPARKPTATPPTPPRPGSVP